jgi:prevent-host-death family protein
MKETYSLYEAKARLSSLVRMVREGRRIVITVHGQPAAELRPIEPAEPGIAGRMAELTARGVLTPPAGPEAPLHPGPMRPGALKRFLESRD